MKAILQGCRAACAQCNDSDVPAEEPLKLKVCSWAEEEVGALEGAHLEYGFLGRVANAHGNCRKSTASSECTSPSTSARSSSSTTPRGPPPKLQITRLRLYDPGTLAPLHVSKSGSLLHLQHKQVEPTSIHDLYEFDQEPLGRGSYGEVIGATHTRTNARRAVKLVAKSGLKRYVDDVNDFVRREVDILRRVDHPNVVRLYEAFEDDKNIYIVLEVCNGGDLLERVTVSYDRMPEHASAALMVQMLSAVQHLGLRGIVHRDLKPENFLFARREEIREPLPPVAPPLKLIDFGLSKRLGLEVGARLTPKIGTMEYMAPEAFSGTVDPTLADRTDVWSLGVVLHVIFIGHFPSPLIGEISMDEYVMMPCWNHISRQGRDLMARLLQRDPRKRPSVTTALKHPWISSLVGISAGGVKLCQTLPQIVSVHSHGFDLRRLALALAAREADETAAYHLREIFQALLIVCDGALTRSALERAQAHIGPPLKNVAEALASYFSVLDTDGSGSLDWTELIASSIGGAALTKDANVAGSIPPLGQDAIWKAFDQLGDGAGYISPASVTRFFGAVEDRRWLQKRPAEFSRTSCAQECSKLVYEVDTRGVGQPTFLALVFGK